MAVELLQLLEDIQMIFELKDLLICALLIAVLYMGFRHYQANKKSQDMAKRMAELECRIVVRLEDRITLLEMEVQTNSNTLIQTLSEKEGQ